MSRIKPVLFSSGIPSNFYQAAIQMEHPFRHELVRYPTNEHRFQAIKVKYCAVGTPEMHDMIVSARTANVAKSMGREVPLDDKELALWDKYNSIREMLEVNLVKYWVHKKCRDWLLGTGSARLVEHRPDPVWGDGMDGSGRNQLGKILELVRSVVR